MEAAYNLIVALAIAAAVISLFAILRLVFRSTSTPGWARAVVPAYAVAVLMTFAMAGSLFYLGFALADVAPAWVAFFGTFAIHIGLVAVFLKLLPLNETTAESQPAARQQTGTREVAA